MNLELVRANKDCSFIIMEAFLKLQPYLSKLQTKRFKEYLHDYLNSISNEKELTKNSDLSKFLENRISSAMNPLLRFIAEICNNIDLEIYFNDSLFCENNRSIDFMVCYLNDLYSYNKELNDNFNQNLVCQIQKNFNCSSERAINLAKKIIVKEKENFDLTSSKLKKKYSSNSEIEKYISSMKSWVLGTLISLKYCPRYKKYNDQAKLAHLK